MKKDMLKNWKESIHSFDDRRDLIVPGDATETIRFCAKQFIVVGQKEISEKGFFAVALSGGSTPKAIYELLSTEEYRHKLDWPRVRLFWSDERCVPPTDKESNFRMAMDAGFASLPIPEKQIFRMPAESPDLESAAKAYEKLIYEYVPEGKFDLVMLGMGDDGHTASLFPKTHGLHPNTSLVITNFIPQKDAWRMTLTFECINQAKEIAIYVLGKSKAKMVKQVLNGPYEPDNYPIQSIGTRTHKALWIVDKDAASLVEYDRSWH